MYSKADADRRVVGGRENLKCRHYSCRNVDSPEHQHAADHNPIVDDHQRSTSVSPLFKAYMDELNRSQTEESKMFHSEEDENSLETDRNSSSRPILRTEMSEPGTCLSICTTSPRGKRDSLGKNISAYRGTDPHSVSYASYNLKGNFDLLIGGLPQQMKVPSSSLEESWKSIYSALLTSDAVAYKPVTIRNPNKAILTIECPSSKVLIANDVACRLFGVGQDQLVGRRLSELISSGANKRNKKTGPSVVDRIFASETSDELLPVYGKVMEIFDSVGEIVPVSVWVHPITTPAPDGGGPSATKECDRWLAVLEPVERFSATCTLGPQGYVFTCDEKVADLFGYNSASEMLGLNILDLIPALVLPVSKIDTDHYKQNLTGRFRGGTSFPVSIKIIPIFDSETNGILKFETTFHVYTTISGLITILPNGTIHSCNSNFVSTLFGYRQEQLLEKPIETIIPKFYRETMPIDDGFYPSPPFDDYPDTSFSQKFPETTPLRKHSSETNNLIYGEFLSPQRLSFTSKHPSTSVCSTPRLPYSSNHTMDRQQTSSSDSDFFHPVCEGSFWGFGKHRDNSLIAIGYQIKRVVFKDGSVLYCLWIVRDPESHLSPHFNLGSRRGSGTTNSSQTPTGELSKNNSFDFEKIEHKFEIESENCEYVRGDYAKMFYTLQQIGKGAFGCVKMAARKSDSLLVVTKFINKEAILTDAWVLDKKLGRVPIEISLLTTLKHPNIVQVLAVCQNDKYFQMVMEKHGDGMDLFEFIDREPRMDECLASYIFRQVVSAVSYLHGQKVLHRDLKDENVIIDEKFWCKIIDFGSAAFMQTNKLFSTFCGTIDYCSPEVLSGNKYAGPELEMWSLGILLYTLVFFENPFHNVDETIAAELDPPWDVSEGLFNLLSWLLHPSPIYRATIKEVERHWWVTMPVEIDRYRFSEVVPLRGDLEVNPSKNLMDLTDLKLATAQTSPADRNRSAVPANHTI